MIEQTTYCPSAVRNSISHTPTALARTQVPATQILYQTSDSAIHHRTTAQLSSRHAASSTALTFLFTLYCRYSQNRYHLTAVLRSLLYFATCSRNPNKRSKYYSNRTSKIMQTQTHNKILQDGCVKCRSGYVLGRCVAWPVYSRRQQMPVQKEPRHVKHAAFHSTLTFRRLMSYIYGAPILDVSRSHTTTQHSR